MPFSQPLPENWPEDFTGELSVDIAHMSLGRLRAAIQNSEISFPSQMPIFACQSRSDIQWRVALLYFVHNWSCVELGDRYGVTMERVRQLISQWARRAAVLGYLQEIPPVTLVAAPQNEMAALTMPPSVYRTDVAAASGAHTA